MYHTVKVYYLDLFENTHVIEALCGFLSEHHILKLRFARSAWILNENNRKLPISVNYHTGDISKRKVELRGYTIHWEA